MVRDVHLDAMRTANGLQLSILVVRNENAPPDPSKLLTLWGWAGWSGNGA